MTDDDKELTDYTELWLDELKAIHPGMDQGLLLHIVKLYKASPSAFSKLCQEIREDPQMFEGKKDTDLGNIKYQSTTEDLIEHEKELLEKQNQDKMSCLLEECEVTTD